MTITMAKDIIWIYKGFVMFGMGGWMLMAACNNLLDPQTNVTLLKKMMSMDDLRLDGKLGQGLLFRSIQADAFALPMLLTIAGVQIVISLSLLLSALLLFNVPIGLIDLSTDITITFTMLSILLFTAHWFVFLIGGLWFGYWIKMGPVQMVHLTMLILSIFLQLLIGSSL